MASKLEHIFSYSNFLLPYSVPNFVATTVPSIGQAIGTTPRSRHQQQLSTSYSQQTGPNSIYALYEQGNPTLVQTCSSAMDCESPCSSQQSIGSVSSTLAPLSLGLVSRQAWAATSSSSSSLTSPPTSTTSLQEIPTTTTISLSTSWSLNPAHRWGNETWDGHLPVGKFVGWSHPPNKGIRKNWAFSFPSSSSCHFSYSLSLSLTKLTSNRISNFEWMWKGKPNQLWMFQRVCCLKSHLHAREPSIASRWIRMWLLVIIHHSQQVTSIEVWHQRSPINKKLLTTVVEPVVERKKKLINLPHAFELTIGTVRDCIVKLFSWMIKRMIEAS